MEVSAIKAIVGDSRRLFVCFTNRPKLFRGGPGERGDKSGGALVAFAFTPETGKLGPLASQKIKGVGHNRSIPGQGGGGNPGGGVFNNRVDIARALIDTLGEPCPPIFVSPSFEKMSAWAAVSHRELKLILACSILHGESCRPFSADTKLLTISKSLAYAEEDLLIEGGGVERILHTLSA